MTNERNFHYGRLIERFVETQIIICRGKPA